MASDDELLKSTKVVWLFDIEIYSNYLLIAFKSYETGNLVFFEEFGLTQKLDKRKLRWMVDNLTLVGFNSNHFDKYILWATLAGKFTNELKEIADSIILGQMQQKEIESRFGFQCKSFDHIDLNQVAPAAAQQLSLKHYGARMQCPRLQELPYAHDIWLTEFEAHEVKHYCTNDLDITGWLYHKLKTPIELREEMGAFYHYDLRSCSDAQIAEKAIGAELRTRTGVTFKAPALKGEVFKYQDPGYLEFQTPLLQRLKKQIYETVFVVDNDGKIKVLKTDGSEGSATNLWKVKVNNTSYTLGIGGLHSEEKSRSLYSTDEVTIYDRDVASYYPAIILNQGLYPKHIKSDFLHVYRDIVDRRLKAKKDGDKQTSESLKICINGCFGKLGNRWSIFFSPELLLQVTVTGQLSLLLLIESLELAGIAVASANTDGVMILCPTELEAQYRRVVADWEARTKFQTEEVKYKSLHSRDVNTYIAIGTKNEIKAKGTYVNSLSMKNPDRESLMINPNFSICTEAVMKFLQTCKDKHPISIDKTIKDCTDITKFIAIRRVNGGAIRNGITLGKVIRWYIRKHDFGAIYYKNENAAGSTNKVADTDGGYPLMELPDELPNDIDYSWYIKRANQILHDVGFYKSEDRQLTLFS